MRKRSAECSANCGWCGRCSEWWEREESDDPTETPIKRCPKCREVIIDAGEDYCTFCAIDVDRENAADTDTDSPF